MTDIAADTRSVIIEREFAAPADKIWRALTEPHLLEAWLMKSDFKAVADHRFAFRADWGSVDCQVLEIDPPKVLSYSWGAHGLESVVTWTLSPKADGTLLRMEQVGFRPDQEQAYRGATAGWPRFFAALDDLLARTQ